MGNAVQVPKGCLQKTQILQEQQLECVQDAGKPAHDLIAQALFYIFFAFSSALSHYFRVVVG